MRVMNQALKVGLDYLGENLACGSRPGPPEGPPPIYAGVPGASGPLGRCALVYMDDCLVHSPTLAQHLLDVAEVLEIFHRRQLFAKRSKCEFGRQELSFLGHRLSKEGISMDRKLTSAEWNYPAHVLELLAVVHALRVFRHYLLGGGAPRQEGCWSDFDLRTDNQAITWLKTNRHLNKMYVCWLDEIEDHRFDVTHLPGSRNPTDPLSRRGFADGNGPAPSTGEANAESQQELFWRLRLGRDAPGPARLTAVRARWATGRRQRRRSPTPSRGGRPPLRIAQGGGALPPLSYVPSTCRCGATAGDRDYDGPVAADSLGRPLPLADVRPDLGGGAGRR